MVRRSLRAGLLPGLLTSGQQNRILDYLQERTALRGGSLWSAFVAASRHAAADYAHHLHGTTPAPLEVRVRELAAELTTTPITAAFALAYASGLRQGIDVGRDNLIRERTEANQRRRAKEQPPPPPFDPVRAQGEIDDARRFARNPAQAALDSLKRQQP